MITYEINKPEEPNLFQQAKETVRALIGVPLPERWKGPRSNTPDYMGKVEYARWVEGIKAQYPIGSLWTLSALVYVPEREPVPCYKVVGVEEIHWSAPIGETHKQPRCVQVESVQYPGRPVTYEPKMLRRLTEEELKLVNLRNTQETPNGNSGGEASNDPLVGQNNT